MANRSESIAQLAAALAKAQIELVNPVKTMTGVIDRRTVGNEGQSYRYAPLSAGLDIIRKALCKYELAVIQTTHVEQRSEVLILTTTLAHGSGEFICATWPVCRTNDLTDPKLMGAALTYARRYGLFTLVGIAGEDDLDAPSPTLLQASRGGKEEAGEVHGRYDDLPASGREGEGRSAAVPQRRKRRDAGVPRGPRSSDDLDRMVSELTSISDSDALFRWTLRSLPARNRLSETARRTLDLAFFRKSEEFGGPYENPIEASDSTPALNGEIARLGAGR